MCLGLNVGDLAELLHEFRDIDEPGKPGVQPVAGAVRGEFHRGDGFAKRGRPGIEMVHLEGLERGHLEIPLHREHLRHAVGDGRAGGKDHPGAGVHALDVEHLQEHVERALRGGLRQPGDAGHLGDVEQVLEIVGLVHEQPVHAQFLEGEAVVLLLGGGQFLELGLPAASWRAPAP